MKASKSVENGDRVICQVELKPGVRIALRDLAAKKKRHMGSVIEDFLTGAGILIAPDDAIVLPPPVVRAERMSRIDQAGIEKIDGLRRIALDTRNAMYAIRSHMDAIAKMTVAVADLKKDERDLKIISASLEKIALSIPKSRGEIEDKLDELVDKTDDIYGLLTRTSNAKLTVVTGDAVVDPASLEGPNEQKESTILANKVLLKNAIEVSQDAQKKIKSKDEVIAQMSNEAELMKAGNLELVNEKRQLEIQLESAKRELQAAQGAVQAAEAAQSKAASEASQLRQQIRSMANEGYEQQKRLHKLEALERDSRAWEESHIILNTMERMATIEIKSLSYDERRALEGLGMDRMDLMLLRHVPFDKAKAILLALAKHQAKGSKS